MTRPHVKLGVGVALTAVALPAAALAATHHPAIAQTRDLKVTVAGHAVTVSGSVKLTPDTAARRAITGVAIELTGLGHYDRDVVGLSRTGTFKRIFDTTLTGTVVVHARAIEGIHDYLGNTITRTVNVAAAPSTVTTTSTTPTGTTAAAPITTTTAPAGEVPLIGTFEIGSGSYFQMLNGAIVVPNPAAAGGGITTPLAAGTDGGLETFGYQPAPNPAFAKAGSGNALAARIVTPVSFEGTNFSIQTSATDAQTSTADPVPVIYTNQTGTISGQLTAWDAQWNGLSFNQGTPKPDGSTPSPTTSLSGTYNYATGAYTLNWKSLIQGGPFNGFTGSWHIQGTFKPASFS